MTFGVWLSGTNAGWCRGVAFHGRAEPCGTREQAEAAREEFAAECRLIGYDPEQYTVEPYDTERRKA